MDSLAGVWKSSSILSAERPRAKVKDSRVGSDRNWNPAWQVKHVLENDSEGAVIPSALMICEVSVVGVPSL